MAEIKRPKTATKRVFNKDVVLHHDLYVLENADYKRNVSYVENQIVLENVTHGHFFHSIDSSGRPMTHCEAIGGHKHIVKTSTNDNGELVGICGPAIGLERNGDNHTHVVTYKRSEPVKPRKVSPEAMAEFERQTNPLGATPV